METLIQTCLAVSIFGIVTGAAFICKSLSGKGSEEKMFMNYCGFMIFGASTLLALAASLINFVR